ncbi:MAG: SPASM domain-containing protein [Nitrospirota bacterium]|nr:SPASM domain-containing protein [Nitrospirota bacterium]
MISEFPKRIVIELTPLCNLACSMCPRHFIDEKDGFMARGLWEKLIGEITEASPDSIILPFWRGESMLHPEFSSLLEYALDRSLRVHISTNGHFPANRHREVLMRCEFVTFSIHSDKGYVYSREFLTSRANDSAPTVQVSFVKGESSTDKILSGILDLPELGGFDSVRLYDEHTKDGVFGKGGYEFDIPRTFCPKLTDTLVIAADGTISRCNHIWETEKGVDLNTATIKEAWESTRLREVRQNYPDNLCGPCDQWTGHTCGESWRMTADGIVHQIYGPAGIVND